MSYPIIDGVAIPLFTDEYFTCLDLRNALDYYPDYKRHGGRLSWGGYVSVLFNEIDTTRPDGYTADMANAELITWLTPKGYLDRFMKVKAEGDAVADHLAITE